MTDKIGNFGGFSKGGSNPKQDWLYTPMEVFRSKKVLVDGALQPARIYVRKGKIVKVASGHQLPEDDLDQTDLVDNDLGSLVVMPGLVDSAVHLNDPVSHGSGWEGCPEVTRAAAAGGFTAVVDLPVFSVPSMNSVDLMARKIKRIMGRTHVDVALLAGVHASNIANIRPLVKSGVAGFKCFLGDTGCKDLKAVTDVTVLENILHQMDKSDTILHVEANFDQSKKPALPQEERGSGDYQAYLESRPEAKEHEAIRMVAEAMYNTGGQVKVHLNNLASGSACQIVKQLRDEEGLPITADTTTYYLTLKSEQVTNGATEFKANPPIRNAANQEMLWDGIREGVIQNVVTNHLALPPDVANANKGDFFKARSGFESLQLALPLMWTLGQQQGMHLEEVHAVMSEGPAMAAGLELRKGKFEVGYDADIVAWDPSQRFTVTQEMLMHRDKVTPKRSPFLGMQLQGVVKQTVVRGRTVYEEGKLKVSGKPPGQLLLHGELADEVGRFGDVVEGGPQIRRRLSRQNTSPNIITSVPGGITLHETTRRRSYYT